ncbi:hypothetical protein QWZ08_10030 [Ferruginibacter paludis]|uniref:hypothetical protein n=1 Tax=Ferruginibacter paludis TaxID=1310417 RepID=UPI0025B47591|nr:hypothetical protein [Ferruginibacter paludis]MDN3655964.1 hypothetical protein [Ferruginibacter paludis]
MKKRHVLLVDNFSPSWIKQSVTESDPSLLTKTDFHFNTHTASGRPATGPVGICDTLIFGHVMFEQCPFYVMKDEATPSDFDGVLGSELMNKGIWEINFSKDELIFTSSIDSLPDAAGCEPLQATFRENSITLNVKFSNGVTKRISVDLGFNQGMMLPHKDYKDIGKKNVYVLSDAKFTTASDSQHVTAFATVDTIKIGDNRFVTSVLAAENNEESLVGLQFFKRFKFIILDFKNKKLLIPKIIR